ncbi:MAG: histidine kinase [Chitinophagales bacterium]|nr:histidine kinase [Chitinophagales bacterium]
MRSLILILFFCWTNQLSANRFELNKDFIVAEGSDNIEYYLSTDSVSNPFNIYFQMKNSEYEQIKKYLFFTTQSQKWMFFNVYNAENVSFDFIVEMSNFGLSQIDYYIFHKDALIDSGSVATRGGLKTSKYYDRNIVIPYTALPKEEYSFLVRIYTNAPIYDLPVVVWNKNNKFAISQGIELGRGLFYGVLLFFIIITGLVVYLIRERSYIYYWLYLSSGGMLLLIKSGIPLEVFWPGRSYLDFVVRNFFLYLYLIVTLRFLKEFISSRVQSGWNTTLLDIFIVLGIVLWIMYIPFSLLNVMLQDTMQIVQMVYIVLTSILVLVLMIWAFSKVKDRGVLVISILYYFLFSAFLFNPFIEFGFWTGKLIGHFLMYISGFAISLLLMIVTSLRMKSVITSHQRMKYDLSVLNKKYSHSLIEGQEKQRKRVAEELHDGIGAHLAAVKMKLSAMKLNDCSTEEKELVYRIIDNFDESTQNVRDLSHELMPPTLNRYGLEAAITDLSQKYQNEYPIRLYVKTNLKQNKINAVSEVILYRLLHQLIETLVFTHAQKAEIRLVIFPSISNATIQVKYSGGTPLSQSTSNEYQSLNSLVNLLQGKIEYFMSSIWDDELNIDLPVEVQKDE